LRVFDDTCELSAEGLCECGGKKEDGGEEDGDAGVDHLIPVLRHGTPRRFTRVNRGKETALSDDEPITGTTVRMAGWVQGH
jgi:hypothetical protein